MLTREAVSEGHGDAALYLLREGADSEKKDLDGRLAIDTAPDLKVRLQSVFPTALTGQIRSFVLKSAEQEGIQVATA